MTQLSKTLLCGSSRCVVESPQIHSSNPHAMLAATQSTTSTDSNHQTLACTVSLKLNQKSGLPQFARQQGTVTGLPIADAATVGLDEGAKELISISHLKAVNLLSEPKSKHQQLLPSIQSNLDIAPNQLPSMGASSVNTAALAHGKPDVVAVEIAIGVRHLTPEQFAG